MGDVIPFKKRSLKDAHKGKTLCKNGFHKWVVDQNKQFDVKSGKLVTLYKCSRCPARKTKSE